MKSLRNDLPASLVVFLVALPLCLGVAIASGVPPISGIIAGIIGGIVVGLMSTSHVSVSGPAAGLAAIVFAAIADLNNIEAFFFAVCIAGIIQLIMGFLKFGFIANFIPNSVITGMLAAIGILLILKQLPHAVGYDKDNEGSLEFFQPDGKNTFTELLNIFDNFSLGALIISIVGIAIMLIWNKTALKNFKYIPSSLVVVIVGALLAMVFKSIPALAIHEEHFVNLPKVDSNFWSSIIHLPSMEFLGNFKIYSIAFTIAIVASLETLLNIEAVDKLDIHKRETDTSKELIAQGTGNVLAGLLGGIPITSVIVRSSANINAGNATKLSAIFHGVLLLISLLFLSSVLNQIPLSALAAILLLTGYKLANIDIFKKMFKNGWEDFVPFIVTIICIISPLGLLKGVAIGLMVKVFFILRSIYRNPFKFNDTLLQENHHVFKFADGATFFHKAKIKNVLWQLPENCSVTIDKSQTKYMDNDINEIIEDFKIRAQDIGIKLEVIE